MKTTTVAVAVIAGLFVAVIGQQFVPGLGWTAGAGATGAGATVATVVPLAPARPLAAAATALPTAAAPATAAPAVVAPRPVAPSAGTAAGPQRVAQSAPAPAAPAAAAPAQTAPATAAAGGLRGQFKGADKAHKGEGTAEIVKTATGWEARLTQFATTRGPDLEVWLVAHPDPRNQADVTKAKYVSLGRLKSFTGDQSYPLPAGTDPADFKSLVIWCEDFSVLFASAPLSPRS